MRKKILFVILMALALVLLYKAVITERFDLTMDCVVVDQSGTVIDSGIMTIEGIITNVPFSLQELKIEKVDVPFYSIASPPKNSVHVLPPLGSSQYYTAHFHLDVNEMGMQNGMLQFSEDRTEWILSIDDIRIIGSIN